MTSPTIRAAFTCGLEDVLPSVKHEYKIRFATGFKPSAAEGIALSEFTA